MRLREVLSALTGTAFLIGVPLLLSRAGWPLSGVDAGEVAMFLRGGALPARLLAAGLITLAWAAWGVFAFAVLADLARLVGGGGPRMAGLRLLAVLATSGTATATAGPALASPVSEAPVQTSTEQQHKAEEGKPDGVERQRVLAGFATDSAELDAAMRESLESAAGLITEHGGPGTEVTITGHTDPTGPGDHNQELSEKRARAAAEHLRIALGENAQDIEITPRGHGSDKPRSDGATAHAELRRIEISYRLRPAPPQDRPVVEAGKEEPADTSASAPGGEVEEAQQEPVSTVEGLPAPLSAAASAAAGAGAGYLLGRRSRRSAEKAEPAAEQAGAPTGTKAPPDMETATPGPSDQPPAARQEPAPAAGTGAGDLLAGASAGLSVTGPAAPQTIAALLAHAAQDGAPVIATAAALQRLAPATPLPEVKTVGGWEAALVRAEAHLLAAHRDAASAVPPVLLIEPPPSEEGKAKLSALLAADLPARIIVADGFAAAGWHLEAAPTALHLRGPDGQEREADLGELLDPHAAVSNTPKAGPEEAAKEHRSAEEAEAGEPVPGENPAGDQGPPAAATPPTTLGVRVRLFAPRVVVEADGADISTRMRGSARTLLALLATRPEGISAEEAAETLAPGVEAARARAARNNAVSSARRAIRDATGNTQAAVIETDNARLRLEDSALIQVDLWDFDHACQAARKTSDPGRSRRLGAEIRALYQADLLAEISESWVESERERCRRQAAHLFTDLARKAEEVGEKIEWLHEACAIDRYNESLHRALMETQTKAGRPDDAHRTYRTLAENLAALGERPGKELREAAVKLAAHTPALNAE